MLLMRMRTSREGEECGEWADASARGKNGGYPRQIIGHVRGVEFPGAVEVEHFNPARNGLLLNEIRLS